MRHSSHAAQGAKTIAYYKRAESVRASILTSQLVTLTLREALICLICPPAVVPSPHNDINLLKSSLSDISAEDSPSSPSSLPVPSVHGAAPYIPQTIGINLWSSIGYIDKGIIRRDGICSATGGVTAIHINAKNRP